jgi:hypothetical protein
MVSKMTCYWLEDWVWFPGETLIFLAVKNDSGARSTSHPVDTTGLFLQEPGVWRSWSMQLIHSLQLVPRLRIPEVLLLFSWICWVFCLVLWKDVHVWKDCISKIVEIKVNIMQYQKIFLHGAVYLLPNYKLWLSFIWSSFVSEQISIFKIIQFFFSLTTFHVFVGLI